MKLNDGAFCFSSDQTALAWSSSLLVSSRTCSIRAPPRVATLASASLARRALPLSDHPLAPLEKSVVTGVAVHPALAKASAITVTRSILTFLIVILLPRHLDVKATAAPDVDNAHGLR